jgi:hypothetical protein
VLEDACDVFLDIVAQLQAIARAGNELPKQRFSPFDRLKAQVAPVEMNQIKSVQKDRWLILALTQHIKYWQTIFVAPYSLTIDQEGLGPDRQDRSRGATRSAGADGYFASMLALTWMLVTIHN